MISIYNYKHIISLELSSINLFLSLLHIWKYGPSVFSYSSNCKHMQICILKQQSRSLINLPAIQWSFIFILSKISVSCIPLITFIFTVYTYFSYPEFSFEYFHLILGTRKREETASQDTLTSFTELYPIEC